MNRFETVSAEIFNSFRNANSKIQSDKCEFLRKEVAYLGHTITPSGVEPNPEKVEYSQYFPKPKKIKSFLVFFGYYRR